MTKLRLLGIVSFLLISLFLSANTDLSEINQDHCYAVITSVVEGSDESSKIIKSECFGTFADSIFAATNGRTHLNSAITPEIVTEEMLNSGMEANSLLSQVVIGIDWDSSGFAGSSYTWVVSGETGCTSSTQFSISSIPTGWDDRVSSVRGFSGCNYYYHYQNASFGGLSITCNTSGCSTMGSLDNATSSERWRSQP